jgi:phosphoglycerol transferase
MQLPGTDYTIAGMVASQCGIPLFAPFEGNASASVPASSRRISALAIF